jgi:hypothetical protein
MRCAALLLLVGGCSSEMIPAPADLAADGAPADMAPSDLGPKVCAPSGVENFVWQSRPPGGAHQGRCSTPDVDSFIQEFVKGTAATRAAWASAHGTCLACLVTDPTEALLGPVLDYQTLNLLVANSEGCVALIQGDASPSGCGAKLQALRQCTFAACEPNCPVGGPDLGAFDECVAAASSGDCAVYKNMFNFCTGSGDLGLSPCFEEGHGGDREALFRFLSQQFCGT